MEPLRDDFGLTPRQRRKFAVCKKHSKAYCTAHKCKRVLKTTLKKKGIAIPAINRKPKGKSKR